MNTSFCKSCGAQLQPGYQVCPHCGTPVNAQQQPVVPQQQPMPINNQPMGTQPMQQPMPQQPGYQQQPYQQQAQDPFAAQVDDGNAVWMIIGIIFSLAGLILYIMWKDTKPKNAQAALKGAGIGFVIELSLFIIRWI